MIQMLVRLLVRIGVCTVVFTLLLGVSGLIGRGIHTPMVVVDATGFGRPEQLLYEIIDIDRQLGTLNAFTIPNDYSIQSEGNTAHIWQRIEHSETVEWIFSHTDPLTGKLIPRIQFTIPIEFDTAPGQFSVTQLWPEERWRAYIPGSGQILEASGGDPQARLLATLPTDGRGLVRAIFWLNEGRRLGIADAEGLTFMNLDGSERKHLALEAMEILFPAYSWNGKFMFVQDYRRMTSAPPLYEIPVYDAETLAVKSTYTGRSPYWCGQDLIFLSEDASGTPELQLADVETGEVIHLPLRLNGITGTLQNLYSYPVWDGRNESCDAFMIGNGMQMWLAQPETGALTSMINFANIIERNDSSLVYQGPAGASGIEIWRVTLDGSREPELLDTIQTLGQSITFFDGMERGLYLKGVRLMLVDRVSDTQTELAHRVSGRSFYLVP